MTCNICDNIEVVHAEDSEDLFDLLMMIMDDEDLESVCVIADEENTKELLYHAINDEYEIGSIELETYDYDGPFIVTISWEEDNYEITVEKARNENGKYLACISKTYVQSDIPEKCDYINDVIHNKFIDPDLAFVEIGSDNSECDEDEPTGVYTYANEYKGDGVYGQIYVSSNLKDFVESVKADFEDIFID